MIGSSDNTFEFCRLGNRCLRHDSITGDKCLPFVPYHSSDGQYMFMVQERHGHAGSKCFICDATRTGEPGDRNVYGPCSCRGNDWTVDRIDTQVQNYILAQEPDDS